MKKLILVTVAIFAVAVVYAQTPFKKGDKVINAGLGFGTYGAGSALPLSVSFEYGFKDNLFDEKSSLSFGGYAGYYSYQSSFGSFSGKDWGWKYTNILIGGRAAVHYDLFEVKKLDTYAGLMLGYNIASSSYYGESGNNLAVSSSVGGFVYSSFIGARYYFTEKIAAFAEIGYGVSAIELGVSFKL